MCPEDQRLLAGVWKFGLNNWPLVARFVGNGRTRNQCSQRWNRGLNPVLFKGPWTEEEDEKLVALVKEFGEKSWKRIASVLGNRSDVQCRYHFQQIQKKEDGGEARHDVSPTEQSPPKPDAEEDEGLFVVMCKGRKLNGAVSSPATPVGDLLSISERE